MNDQSFEQDLIAAAFRLAGEQGWTNVTAASAARFAGLDLAEARRLLPSRMAIFARFGVFADSHALTGAMQDGTVKDRLFDILMRRVDFVQRHREGVLALGRYAPLDPLLSLWLARKTVISMGWMLEGAGVSAKGIRGELRKRGLAAVWTWTMRAWVRDGSEELSATMAALDAALVRADQAAMQFSGASRRLNTEPGADAPFSAPEDIPGRLS
jgi:ubiquinone biosynthesis protein COQ9